MSDQTRLISQLQNQNASSLSQYKDDVERLKHRNELLEQQLLTMKNDVQRLGVSQSHALDVEKGEVREEYRNVKEALREVKELYSAVTAIKNQPSLSPSGTTTALIPAPSPSPPDSTLSEMVVFLKEELRRLHEREMRSEAEKRELETQIDGLRHALEGERETRKKAEYQVAMGEKENLILKQQLQFCQQQIQSAQLQLQHHLESGTSSLSHALRTQSAFMANNNQSTTLSQPQLMFGTPSMPLGGTGAGGAGGVGGGPRSVEFEVQPSPPRGKMDERERGRMIMGPTPHTPSRSTRAQVHVEEEEEEEEVRRRERTTAKKHPDKYAHLRSSINFGGGSDDVDGTPTRRKSLAERRRGGVQERERERERERENIPQRGPVASPFTSPSQPIAPKARANSPQFATSRGPNETQREVQELETRIAQISGFIKQVCSFIGGGWMGGGLLGGGGSSKGGRGEGEREREVRPILTFSKHQT